MKILAWEEPKQYTPFAGTDGGNVICQMSMQEAKDLLGDGHRAGVVVDIGGTLAHVRSLRHNIQLLRGRLEDTASTMHKLKCQLGGVDPFLNDDPVDEQDT